MRLPRFLKTTVRWYGYILLFLLLVLMLKIALGNPDALVSIDKFAEVALQPVNLYVWGFATVLYAIFVLSMSLRERSSPQSKRCGQ